MVINIQSSSTWCCGWSFGNNDMTLAGSVFSFSISAYKKKQINHSNRPIKLVYFICFPKFDRLLCFIFIHLKFKVKFHSISCFNKFSLLLLLQVYHLRNGLIIVKIYQIYENDSSRNHDSWRILSRQYNRISVDHHQHHLY